MLVTGQTTLRARVEASLVRARFTCFSARSAEAALDRLRRDGCDLLLVDLAIPDAAEALLDWQCSAARPVAILVLTEKGEDAYGLELMRKGAFDYLPKDSRLAKQLPFALERALQRLTHGRQLAAAAEALRRSEERHQGIFEAASVGMMEGDPETGHLLRVNEMFCRITGYSAKELQGKCFLEITHPDDREANWAAYRRALRGETRDYRSEKRYVRKDGSTVWVLVNVFFIRDACGHPVRSVGMAEDITERKQAEADLQLYRDFFFHAPTGLGIGNADGRTFGKVNPAFARMHGYDRPEDLEGRPILDVYAPEERPRVAGLVQQANQGHCQVESVHVRRDGSCFPVLIDLTGVRDQAGRLLHRVVSTVDLSERKRTEAELKELKDQLTADLAAMKRLHDLSTRLLGTSELDELLKATLEATVALQNADFGSIQLYNRESGALDLVAQRGFREDLLGPFSVMHEGEAACGLALQRRQRVIVEDTEADPAYAPYRDKAAAAGFRAVQSTPIFSRDGEPLGMLSTLFRQPHRPSERELQLTDLYARQAAGFIERTRAEEALRISEERLRFAAQAAGFGSYDLDLVTGHGYGSLEFKALFGVGPEEPFRLDADHLPVAIHPDDRPLVRKAVLQSRDPEGTGTRDLEYRVVLPDGTVRWILMRGRTFFEGTGKTLRPVRSRGIALDVTERKQLEQEILEISGREQRRIGHDLHDDLCQRLGGIQLLSGVLEKELAAEGHPQAPQAGRILHQVREALERARLLARGLAPVALEEGGLAAALQELAENSAQLFRIECRFRGDAVVTLADPSAATHLYRITQEAITNAVKHGRAKRIAIRLTQGGSQWELRVRDNGRGFVARETATSGMGLRIMKYRAAMIGAGLSVRSAPGRGTTVECIFGSRLRSPKDLASPRARAG